MDATTHLRYIRSPFDILRCNANFPHLYRCFRFFVSLRGHFGHRYRRLPTIMHQTTWPQIRSGLAPTSLIPVSYITRTTHHPVSHCASWRVRKVETFIWQKDICQISYFSNYPLFSLTISPMFSSLFPHSLFLLYSETYPISHPLPRSSSFVFSYFSSRDIHVYK
jgi:hypothetical protein